MKTLKCDLCEATADGETFEEWMVNLRPHYSEAHADVMAEKTEMAKEDMMREKLKPVEIMNILTKGSTERELNQKDRIESLLKQYDFPIFTSEIIIEEMVRPHSHPVLTLNTRPQTDAGISAQFIHEQFHWFLTDVVNRDDYKKCIAYLKTQYKKPEGDVGSTENGFWLHLIVNYNTRIVLQSLFGNEVIADLYSGMVPYKQIEEIIEANWEKLTNELSDYNMIYEK